MHACCCVNIPVCVSIEYVIDAHILKYEIFWHAFRLCLFYCCNPAWSYVIENLYVDVASSETLKKVYLRQISYNFAGHYRIQGRDQNHVFISDD